MHTVVNTDISNVVSYILWTTCKQMAAGCLDLSMCVDLYCVPFREGGGGLLLPCVRLRVYHAVVSRVMLFCCCEGSRRQSIFKSCTFSVN